MAKHVRFNSNVQIREMSIDKLAHSIEVKTARGIIVPSVPQVSTSVSLISLILWLVALYLIYRLVKYTMR